MEQPIMNPPNPYVGPLRVFPGTLVKVAGRPRPNATRFAINFQTGPSLNPRDDLALHLSPCFTPPRVVRNSLRHGAWGLEEAWGNGQVLGPHQPFEIMVLAEPDQFKIAINGMHYCEFKHRIPFQEITHLTIDGDVDIDRITISSSSAPPLVPAYQPSAPAPSNRPYAPYPTGNNPGMPTPGMYPNLPGAQPSMPTGPYPVPSAYNNVMPPAGPTPTGATYMSGYPQSGGHGYPQMPPSGGHQPGGMYPQHGMGGPMPAGSSYQPGGSYPQPHHQPGHSSNSTFGLPNKALGLAVGAAALSALNPLKPLKKIMKPHKAFKGSGWGRRSSSSSNSSRSSFSSNSS